MSARSRFKEDIDSRKGRPPSYKTVRSVTEELTESKLPDWLKYPTRDGSAVLGLAHSSCADSILTTVQTVCFSRWIGVNH